MSTELVGFIPDDLGPPEPALTLVPPLTPELQEPQLQVQPNIMTIGADAKSIQLLLRAPEVRLLCNFGRLPGFANSVGHYGKFAIDAVVVFGPTEGEDADPVDIMSPLRRAMWELQPYPHRLYLAQRYTGEITTRHLGFQNYSKLLNLRNTLGQVERIDEALQSVSALVAKDRKPSSGIAAVEA